MKGPQTICYKVMAYFSSVWNRFDQFMHLMFIISIMLHFGLSEEHFVWVRICYCLTLILYYLRILQSFFVAKNVGPKVIMIKCMVSSKCSQSLLEIQFGSVGKVNLI